MTAVSTVSGRIQRSHGRYCRLKPLARRSQSTSSQAQAASLASRIRDGDQAAEAELVDTFYSRIFAFTCARTNNRETAKDLTQDVLWAAIVAFRKGQLRDVDKVPNFMLGIARNVVNSHVRSERARPEEELPDEERLSALADIRAAEQTERSMIVRDVIGQLALEEQRVLMLTLVQGMKPGDIAAQLGTSPDVIRTRKSRALKKIAKSMDRLSRNPTGKPHPREGKP